VIYLLFLCQAALALMFAASFYAKARDLRSFRESIAGFGILPRALVRPAALLFVGGELLAAILLIVGLTLPGFALALVLLVIFSAALVSVLARKLPVACGCFGSSRQIVSGYDLARNAGFAVLGALGLALATMGVVAPSPLEAASLTATAAVLMLLWTSLQNVVTLLRTKPQQM
jgi:uncharacterized membrane protein YphA (DoxX/SURF4 family)